MKLSIRTKIVLVTTLVILFFGFLAALFAYNETRRGFLEEKKRSLLTLVSERAGIVEEVLFEGQDIAKVMSESDTVKSYLADPKFSPVEKMNLYLEHFNVRNNFSAIYLLTATGSAVASTDRTFVGNNYGFRSYFKDALTEGMGKDMVIGVTSKMPGFYFSYPVKDVSGKILGVAVAKMSSLPFEEIINSSEVRKFGNSFLVDADGVILFSSKPEWSFRTLAPISSERMATIKAERKFEGFSLRPLAYEKVLEAMTGYKEPTVISIYDREDRREELLSLARIGESKYFLTLESEEGEIIRQSLMVSLLVAGLVLLAALISSVLVVAFLEGFLRPLDLLMIAVRQLGKGDFSANFGLETGDEIEELGRAFDSMVEKLNNSYRTLRDSEAGLRRAQEVGHVGSWELDIPQDDLRWSDEACRIFGVAAGKKLNYQLFLTFVHPEDRENVDAAWRRALNHETYDIEHRIVVDGRVRWVRERAVVEYDAGGNPLRGIGTVQDISDRKRTERELLEASRKLTEEKAKDELILASIGEGAVVMDENGKILLVNLEAAKMFGREAAEMIGRSYLELWEVEDSLGNKIVDRPIQQALSSGKMVFSGDYFYTRRDGSPFPVFLTVTPLIQGGKIVGAVEIFRDVTHDKAIDRAKTEFVSLASHQLRTPLSAVNWYAEMLLSGDLGAIDPNQKKYLEEIYNANRRMVELVNSLLNVSRIDLGTFAVEPEDLLIEKIAKNVVGDLKPQIVYKKINFVENYDPKVPVIKADPQLIRIVVQNLLTNSIKYTGPEGKVSLEVKLVRAGIGVGSRTAPVDSVLIEVSDNGYGIPKNQQDKIFTKLFRADNVKVRDAEGTGLGLYVVKSIVDATGGSIWFDSKEGEGTIFYVLFPLKGMQKKPGTKQLGL